MATITEAAMPTRMTFFTLQKITIDELSKKNDQLSIQLSGIESYLNSDNSIKDNRPSSELLKETFRRLGSTK
jgi:hypothetical protein